MKKNKVFILVFILAVILVNVGCDQISKRIADENLKGKGVIQVVGNVVILKYIKNHGGFLGMGSNLPVLIKTLIFTILPVLLMVSIVVYIILTKHLSLFEIFCLATILGGGASNIFDRIVHSGQVTDFLNFGIGNLRTGILNMADMSITFGALLLVLANYLRYRKDRRLKISEPEGS